MDISISYLDSVLGQFQELRVLYFLHCCNRRQLEPVDIYVVLCHCKLDKLNQLRLPDVAILSNYFQLEPVGLYIVYLVSNCPCE